MEKKMPTVVIGVIGADCHAVGNKIIETILKEEGFGVVNVGVLSTQEEFINAALETDAKAIFVSSLYGHGEMDCEGMREKCQEVGLDDIILYVGGNIVVGKQGFEEVEKRFLGLGFNRAYAPGSTIHQGIEDLKKDLSL